MRRLGLIIGLSTLRLAALAQLSATSHINNISKADTMLHVSQETTVSFYNPILLPRNGAACNLPFFCRQELHFEQYTGVPLRLRLGSVSYTDWLESKPGAVLPR